MRERSDAIGYMDGLSAALAAAGAVFQGLPAVGAVDGCGYCYAEEELRVLGGAPAEVPVDLVRRFAQEGPDHWGAGQYGVLWRGLAGRIVRIVTDDHASLMLAWMLRGPGDQQACFEQWPVSHQDTLLNLYAALLRVAVVSWPPWDVIDALDGMAHLPCGLRPWLARVEEMTGPAADAGLVRLAAQLGTELTRADDDRPWYWSGPNVATQSAVWLASPAVLERLARFARAHPDCETAAEAMGAIDDLAAGDRSRDSLIPGSRPCDACAI